MSESTTEPTKKKSWFARHKILTAIGVIIIIAIISNNGNKTPAATKTGDKAQTASTANTGTPAATVAAKAAQPTPTPAPKAPSVPAEYKSALSKATSYSSMQHLSKQGVYDQLTSEYGEKFSAAAARYAIDNVKADWNANALAKAKSYQSQQSMSPASIHDQLTSSFGEKFTAAEADYAIQHLND
jgi:hypothetical protein